MGLELGAGIADACVDLLRSPVLVGGQFRQVGPVTFASMDDVNAALAQFGQDFLNWSNRGARLGEVLAHFVYVAPLAAEVCLHVDDDRGAVFSGRRSLL